MMRVLSGCHLACGAGSGASSAGVDVAPPSNPDREQRFDRAPGGLPLWFTDAFVFSGEVARLGLVKHRCKPT